MNRTELRQLFIRYSLLDWIFNVVLLVLLLTIEYYPLSPAYRPFSRAASNEPLHSTTVPFALLALVVYLIIPVFLLVVWSLNSFNSTIFRVLAAYYYAVLFSSFLTSLIQRLTRRAKPDTAAMCGGTFESCKEILKNRALLNQFTSFPSSHAALAMSAGMFVAFLFTEIDSEGTLLVSFVKIIPMVFAFLVGASRVWDRASHVDDVVAGFMIGGLVGYFAFRTLLNGLKSNQKNDEPSNSASTNSIPGY